jgi:hypothetical protein
MNSVRGRHWSPSALVVDLAGGALALGLTFDAVALTSGLDPTPTQQGYHQGGVGASLAVIAMTLPVGWARRAPVAAAVCLGVAAPLNGLAFGKMVRCGAALPALFYVAVCLGVAGWNRRTALGSVFVVVSLGAQSFYDPRLNWSALPLLVPVAVAFYGIGRLVGQRITLITDLRQRNADLVTEQKKAAALAVAIERQRVAGQLDGSLRAALARIESVATDGRVALVGPSGREVDTRAVFVEIESRGRDTLTGMRAVLQGLREAGSG